MYPDHAAQGDVAVYQFTTSSAVAPYLAEHGLPLILDFHNFTGPRATSPAGSRGAWRGRPQAADELALTGARRRCSGWPRAAYSERELRQAGCRRTAVVPVLADYGRVTATARPAGGGRAGRGERADGGADILFVGRVVPSKAQHELVKALWAYRRLYDARARLHLVGGTSSFEYSKALLGFVEDLGLAGAVRLTGEVSDASLAAYFGAADVYLSLSAHEGFGVPLVEAMVAGRPGGGTRRRCAWPTRWPTPRLSWPRPTPPTWRPPLHRACTDDRLRATLAAAGQPPGRRAVGRRGGRADRRRGRHAWWGDR